MAGRYLRTKPMAVLYIPTQQQSGAKASSSALLRSLSDQSSKRWTTNSDHPDVTASLCVDGDCRLDSRTVETVLEALDRDPTIDAIVADAVVAGRGVRRPAWSPTRLLGNPADLDLLVVRGSHGATDLAARLDLIAELGPRARIVHLPAGLVHVERPVELTHADRLAHQRLVLQRLPNATTSDPTNRGRFVLSTNKLEPVSVVIPTAGTTDSNGVPMVARAINAVRRSAKSPVEILLVIGDEYTGDAKELEAEDVHLVRRPPGPWNFSASVNLGILASTQPQVLVLNDDVELVEPGWLDQMSVHLQDQQVGAVGALLLYPDHTVQHVGMVTDDAYPLHSFVGRAADELRSFDADIAAEVIAVTAACLLARRRDLLAIGGFNESLPHGFNDVDLCLKLHRSGQRVVVEPNARLIHHESASRPPVTNQWEWDRFVGRWGDIVDPWYHPGHRRLDDPHNRRANADHLDPSSPPFITTPRDTILRPRVHHARIGASDSAPTNG